MKVLQLTALGVLVWFGLLTGAVFGHGCGPRLGWSVGFNVGPPVCYRPWVHYPVYYYRPYPLVVEAPPVIYQPAPVVMPAPQPALQMVTPGPIATQAASSPLQPVSATTVTNDNADYYLQQLTRAEETLRRDAVMELGRARAARAVDPLCATLAGDRSPLVREAAAQALGLIAAPKSLPALTRAAQADSDRDVRRTAQFAIEIIHSQLRRN